MSWYHRCIAKFAAFPQITPINNTSVFGLIFLKFCVDCHQVGKVDRSYLTLELSLFRPMMPHYLVLDDLGELHIVSFV